MSNLININQLKKSKLLSDNSKIFTVPTEIEGKEEYNNCYIINVKELLQLSTPQNYTSNTGKCIILRSLSNSLTFSFFKEGNSTSNNIINYNNNYIDTNSYNINTGYTFNFDNDDLIKEIKLLNFDTNNPATKLIILSGTLYGLDISSYKDINTIQFENGTFNSLNLDLLWNKKKEGNKSIITGLDPTIIQDNIKWNCQNLIEKDYILNRKITY